MSSKGHQFGGDWTTRKLEVLAGYLKSYTTPGKATVFVNLKDSTPAARAPDIWYQVRKKIYDIRNDLPQGIIGPGFNDEFGDTYGIVYGFTGNDQLKANAVQIFKTKGVTSFKTV